MTVSRVINNEANVREETRELVNSAIAELGYAPNEAARSLAGATQIHIALLFTNPSAAYLSEFLVGSLEKSRALNVQLVVEKCGDGDDAEEAIRRLRAGGADGVLLAPPLADSPQVLKVLETTDTPAVIVTSSSLRENISVVSIDDYEAALTMTRHIISLGHKRIGFIIGHPNQLASERRLAGYRDALKEAGLPHAPELEVQGLFTYRSGLEAADQLLNLEPMPTAIFASNDDMAAAVISVAHRRGLDVPGDLTVVGFDDTAPATTVWPELTTIRQPVSAMAAAALDMLLAHLRSRRRSLPPAPAETVFEHQLVVRQSSGPPPAATRSRTVAGNRK
jgi:LacI family transcriptional regulator